MGIQNSICAPLAPAFVSQYQCVTQCIYCLCSFRSLCIEIRNFTASLEISSASTVLQLLVSTASQNISIVYIKWILGRNFIFLFCLLIFNVFYIILIAILSFHPSLSNSTYFSRQISSNSTNSLSHLSSHHYPFFSNIFLIYLFKLK